jgi:hypothetical protein
MQRLYEEVEDVRGVVFLEHELVLPCFFWVRRQLNLFESMFT